VKDPFPTKIDGRPSTRTELSGLPRDFIDLESCDLEHGNNKSDEKEEIHTGHAPNTLEAPRRD
jgi:hypothetical protein